MSGVTLVVTIKPLHCPSSLDRFFFLIGLLCVTCTDTSILCGNFVEACFAKYGSVSLKTKYKHEMVCFMQFCSFNFHF